jgi:hypothetical protein
MRQLDTAYLLQEWGAWLRIQTGLPRYVSPSFALMRDNVQFTGSRTPCITDETAMTIDRLVSRLNARYEECGIALFNYYRHGWTYRQLAREMTHKLGRPYTHVKAQKLVEVGSAWIDSALCHYAEAA